MIQLLLNLFRSTVLSATPLVLCALGGLISERAGVVNIALEGMLLTGAFTATLAGSNGWVGLIAAIIAGCVMGLLHGLLTQKSRMNQLVSGLALNLLAAGGTRYLSLRYFPSEGAHLVGLSPWWFVAAAIMGVLLTYLLLAKTRFGLQLRAVGESTSSAEFAGVKVIPTRLLALAIGGGLAGFGGAYLSLAEAHTFTSNMSAGKGYIALAAVIFGKWKPAGAMAGALLFGLFYAIQTQLQISGFHSHLLGIDWSSPALLDTLPYIITLLALASVIGKAEPPGELGR